MLKGVNLFESRRRRRGLLVLAFAAAAAIFFKLGYGPAAAPNGPRAPETLPPAAASPTDMDGRNGIRRLVFSRGKHIYLYDASSGAVTKLAEGRFPSISPSGKAVAFLQDDDPRGDESSIRILDLGTNRVSSPKPLAAARASMPLWSPTGDRLAFQALVNGKFHVGVYDPANDSLKVLSGGLRLGEGFGVFLDSWAADGKSVVAHTLEQVYEFSLEGKELWSLSFDALKRPEMFSSITSASRFSLSEDKRRLLFDAVNRAPEDIAILVYDLERQSLSRLTPADVSGSAPQWLPSGKGVLFTRVRRESRRLIRDVEKLELGEAKTTTVIRDAFAPSFSN